MAGHYCLFANRRLDPYDIDVLEKMFVFSHIGKLHHNTDSTDFAKVRFLLKDLLGPLHYLYSSQSLWM